MTRLSFRAVADATFYEKQVARGGFIAGLRRPLQIIERTGYIAIDIAGIAQCIVTAGIVGDGFEHGERLGRVTAGEQPYGPVDDDCHTVGCIVVIDAHVTGVTQLGQGFPTEIAISPVAPKTPHGALAHHGIGYGVDDLQEAVAELIGRIGVGYIIAQLGPRRTAGDKPEQGIGITGAFLYVTCQRLGTPLRQPYIEGERALGRCQTDDFDKAYFGGAVGRYPRGQFHNLVERLVIGTVQRIEIRTVYGIMHIQRAGLLAQHLRTVVGTVIGQTMQHGIFLCQRIGLRHDKRYHGIIGRYVTERLAAQGVEGIDRATAFFLAGKAEGKIAVTHPRLHGNTHLIPQGIAGNAFRHGRIPLLPAVEPRFPRTVLAMPLALKDDGRQCERVARPAKRRGEPHTIVFLHLPARGREGELQGEGETVGPLDDAGIGYARTGDRTYRKGVGYRRYDFRADRNRRRIDDIGRRDHQRGVDDKGSGRETRADDSRRVAHKSGVGHSIATGRSE